MIGNVRRVTTMFNCFTDFVGFGILLFAVYFIFSNFFNHLRGPKTEKRNNHTLLKGIIGALALKEAYDVLTGKTTQEMLSNKKNKEEEQNAVAGGVESHKTTNFLQ